MNFLKAMFGNYSKREVKRVQPICDKVLALEDKYAAMSESELKNQTTILKERLANGETTDDILPEAFATCREAGWRVLGMKHFPVQIIGGIVLHQGRIAEMKTGEGKTLVATLPAYLNALTGEGVHIVTVNDYLARRDSEWMGKLYRYLGLSVGLICHDLDNEGRKKAYAADITYGTNNELGFDYLRDNMVVYKENKVQRPHAFAIVDEVDSILIDEARTPLIISGKGDKSTDLYAKADALATNYNRRNKNVRLYELGNIYIPKELPLTELPDERMQFTLGMYGEGDFFNMKGVIEEFFEKIGMKGREKYDPNAGKTFLHPGRQANIIYDGKVVGYLGEVHPEVADIYGIGERAYVAVLDMPEIIPYATFDRKYTGIAKYPAVTRDISMVVPKEILVGQIEDVIEKKGGAHLESYSLFDIYEGAQIKAGFKSVAYSIVFRAKDKTLEEAEITAAMNRILSGLEELGIELRK